MYTKRMQYAVPGGTCESGCPMTAAGFRWGPKDYRQKFKIFPGSPIQLHNGTCNDTPGLYTVSRNIEFWRETI